MYLYLNSYRVDFFLAGGPKATYALDVQVLLSSQWRLRSSLIGILEMCDANLKCSFCSRVWAAVAEEPGYLHVLCYIISRYASMMICSYYVFLFMTGHELFLYARFDSYWCHGFLLHVSTILFLWKFGYNSLLAVRATAACLLLSLTVGAPVSEVATTAAAPQVGAGLTHNHGSGWGGF